MQKSQAYNGIWNHKQQSGNSPWLLLDLLYHQTAVETTVQHSLPLDLVSHAPEIIQFMSATDIHNKAKFILTCSTSVQKMTMVFLSSRFRVFQFVIDILIMKTGAGTVSTEVFVTASLTAKMRSVVGLH